MYFGIKLFGPQTFTSAPNFLNAKIFDKATLECRTSPTITIFLPFKSLRVSTSVNESNKA